MYLAFLLGLYYNCNKLEGVNIVMTYTECMKKNLTKMKNYLKIL